MKDQYSHQNALFAKIKRIFNINISLFTLLPAALFAACLSSCNKTPFSAKVYSVTEFTPKLHKESTIEAPLNVPAAATAKDWPDSKNFMNIQPSNIAINNNPYVLKSYSLKMNGKIAAAPVCAEGKIFILSDKGEIYAFDNVTLNQVWVSPLSITTLKGNIFTNNVLLNKSHVTYNNGKLAITLGNKNVLVLGASNGKVLLAKTLFDAVRTQSVISGNLLYVVTVSNSLYAIDIQTGRTVWMDEAMPETITSSSSISPFVYNGNLIAGYSNGVLSTYKSENGNILFRTATKKELGNEEVLGYDINNFEAQPIIENSDLYFASKDSLQKVNVNSTSVYWRKDIKDIKSIYHSGNYLFIITNAKQISAINKANGIVEWVADLDSKNKDEAKVFFGTIMLNSKLYVISPNTIYKLNPQNGIIMETIPLKQNISYFAVINQKLMLFTNKNQVLR